MPIEMESSSENALAPDTPMHAESNGVKKQRRRHPKKPKDILDEPRRESSRPIRQKVQSAETESVSNEKENVKEKSCGNDSEYDEADEEVEDILERVTYEDGNVYFRIRWKGYGPEDDTWEPKKNLDCPKLIEEFERWRVEQKAKAKKNGTYAKKKAESRYTLGDSDDHFTMPYGFARGLEPKEIVGASDDGGKLKFLMKWVDGPQTDIVLAEEANVKCPQIVISYYEKFWGWSDRKPNGYWADEEEFEARRKDATKKISENAHVENGLNKENISSRSGAAIK